MKTSINEENIIQFNILSLTEGLSYGDESDPSVVPVLGLNPASHLLLYFLQGMRGLQRGNKLTRVGIIATHRKETELNE